MNIIIINNFWRYPETERWDFELVEYEKLVCHNEHSVTYIVDPRGKSAITAEPETYCLYEVDNFNNLDELRGIFRETEQKVGKIDRVIAFSENLLSPAAILRDEFSIPGASVAEIDIARNKVKMKQKINDKGLAVPRFIELKEETVFEDILNFVNEVGYPLILKPVDGASSIDVSQINDEQQLLTGLSSRGSGEWELEKFIFGEIYHIDGIVNSKGDVIFSVPSKYINTCLEFSFNTPLGSIMVPESCEYYEKIQIFTKECLLALDFHSCAFHLELFITKGDDLVFLEVGARVAGADVPYVIAKSTGVNLFKHWVDLILYSETEISPINNGYGAWVLFGLPEKLPQVVAEVSDFFGEVNSVYRQLTPKLNSPLIKERGYCSLQSGRFLFSDDNHKALTKDVERVVNEFNITFKELVN
jgi:biotin carboxylase